jgi:hypothetical protein
LSKASKKLIDKIAAQLKLFEIRYVNNSNKVVDDKVIAATKEKEKEEEEEDKLKNNAFEEWTDYQLQHGIILGHSDDPTLVREQGDRILALHKEWLKIRETPEYQQEWAERRRQKHLEIQKQQQQEREEEDREIIKIMKDQKQKKLPTAEDPERAQEVMELHRRWLWRKKHREQRELRANYRDEEGRDFFGFKG